MTAKREQKTAVATSPTWSPESKNMNSSCISERPNRLFRKGIVDPAATSWQVLDSGRARSHKVCCDNAAAANQYNRPWTVNSSGHITIDDHPRTRMIANTRLSRECSRKLNSPGLSGADGLNARP